MSDSDRAAARAELHNLYASANPGFAHDEALEAVAAHVLANPHRWRALLDVPYPDAPDTRRAEAMHGNDSPLLRGWPNLITDPLPATCTDGRPEWRVHRFGDGEDAREIAAREAGLCRDEGQEGEHRPTDITRREMHGGA